MTVEEKLLNDAQVILSLAKGRTIIDDYGVEYKLEDGNLYIKTGHRDWRVLNNFSTYGKKFVEKI